MAPKGDVKDFYRQRKKGGITKPLPKVKAGVSSSSSCSYSKTSLPSPPASLGSDFVQPPALISHGSLDPEGLSPHYHSGVLLLFPVYAYIVFCLLFL